MSNKKTPALIQNPLSSGINFILKYIPVSKGSKIRVQKISNGKIHTYVIEHSLDGLKTIKNFSVPVVKYAKEHLPTIRKLKEMGFSQKDIAEISGWSPSTISRVIRKK